MAENEVKQLVFMESGEGMLVVTVGDQYHVWVFFTHRQFLRVLAHYPLIEVGLRNELVSAVRDAMPIPVLGSPAIEVEIVGPIAYIASLGLRQFPGPSGILEGLKSQLPGLQFITILVARDPRQLRSGAVSLVDREGMAHFHVCYSIEQLRKVAALYDEGLDGEIATAVRQVLKGRELPDTSMRESVHVTDDVAWFLASMMQAGLEARHIHLS